MSNEWAQSDLRAIRGGPDAAVDAGMFRADPPSKAITLNGIAALHVYLDVASTGMILHVHDGGFRLGQPEQVGSFASALASRSGMTVVCLRYRLAPEHPFPAALNDVQSVWHALSAAEEGLIVVSENSAGCASRPGWWRCDGCARSPAALLLLSAWRGTALASAAETFDAIVAFLADLR